MLPGTVRFCNRRERMRESIRVCLKGDRTSGGGDDMERACRSREVFFNAGQKLTEDSRFEHGDSFLLALPFLLLPPTNIENTLCQYSTSYTEIHR